LIKHLKTYTVVFAKMRSQFYIYVMYCVNSIYVLVNISKFN